MTRFYKHRLVLQKLIYTDPDFTVWLQGQRAAQNAADTLLERSSSWPPLYVDESMQVPALLIKTILPPLELVFAAA